MDDRLRLEIRQIAEQLLAKEKATFRSAVTLLEIEELTCQIGDEPVRQLANGDLAERSDETAGQEQFFCPTCGRSCAAEQDPEPLILQGKRSEIEYSEPRCHCRSCRRDFFPSRGATATSGS